MVGIFELFTLIHVAENIAETIGLIAVQRIEKTFDETFKSNIKSA